MDLYKLIKNRPNVPAPPEFNVYGNILETDEINTIGQSNHVPEHIISAAGFNEESMKSE